MDGQAKHAMRPITRLSGCIINYVTERGWKCSHKIKAVSRDEKRVDGCDRLKHGSHPTQKHATYATQHTQRLLLSLRFGRCVSCARWICCVFFCVRCVRCVKWKPHFMDGHVTTIIHCSSWQTDISDMFAFFTKNALWARVKTLKLYRKKSTDFDS